MGLGRSLAGRRDYTAPQGGVVQRLVILTDG